MSAAWGLTCGGQAGACGEVAAALAQARQEWARECGSGGGPARSYHSSLKRRLVPACLHRAGASWCTRAARATACTCLCKPGRQCAVRAQACGGGRPSWRLGRHQCGPPEGRARAGDGCGARPHVPCVARATAAAAPATRACAAVHAVARRVLVRRRPRGAGVNGAGIGGDPGARSPWPDSSARHAHTPMRPVPRCHNIS